MPVLGPSMNSGLDFSSGGTAMKRLSCLFPAQWLTSALAVTVCLCFGGGGCVRTVALPVAPGPQIYDVNGSNVNHTGTAGVTNLSGQFELPPNQQLDPPAPVGGDGNVVLDPTFNYWLKSDDQVLVSWSDFSLDLPCAGSSDFRYNLCADQTLLQQGASEPAQCPRDILALHRSFVIRGPSTVISMLDPDSQISVHIFNCPGLPGSINCAGGTALPDRSGMGGLAHWIWDSGCSLPNPRFRNPTFQPIFGGTFQLWVSWHEDWFRYTPSEPPDKLGSQITLPAVLAGSPQTDPVRVRFVAACGPPTASNPNLAGCGASDSAESHWVADLNTSLSEGFGARLRVEQLGVFDSPQGTSGPIAFCWAQLTGGQSQQAISNCSASAPGPCQASPPAGTDATPGTPFGKPFTVRTGPNALDVAPDASPWVIGFSDASGGRCPNITNRTALWVEFTLETRP